MLATALSRSPPDKECHPSVPYTATHGENQKALRAIPM